MLLSFSACGSTKTDRPDTHSSTSTIKTSDSKISSYFYVPLGPSKIY